MHTANLTLLLSNNSTAITGLEDGTLEIAMIVIGLISVLFAFFAFRLLRIETCLLGIGIGIVLGFSTFEIALEDPFSGYLALIVSIALSVVGVVLALKLHRVMVYVNVTILIFAVIYVILAIVLGLIFSQLDMNPISAFLSIALTIPVAANLKKYFKQFSSLLPISAIRFWQRSVSRFLSPTNTTISYGSSFLQRPFSQRSLYVCSSKQRLIFPWINIVTLVMLSLRALFSPNHKNHTITTL